MAIGVRDDGGGDTAGSTGGHGNGGGGEVRRSQEVCFTNFHYPGFMRELARQVLEVEEEIEMLGDIRAFEQLKRGSRVRWLDGMGVRGARLRERG